MMTVPDLPAVGDVIRYRTKTARRGYLESIERVGVVTVIWTNGWDGPHIDTTTGCCIPSLGDQWHIEKGETV